MNPHQPTDQFLDMIGIPEDATRILRAILKASTAVPASQAATRQPSMAAVMTPGLFREMFPALTQQAWLDTPASGQGRCR